MIRKRATQTTESEAQRTQTCSTCAWGVADQGMTCHRFPPVADAMNQASGKPVWPRVTVWDTCGEWKQREVTQWEVTQ